MHLIQFFKTTFFLIMGGTCISGSQRTTREGEGLVLHYTTWFSGIRFRLPGGDKLLYLLSHFAGPIFFETNSRTEPGPPSFLARLDGQ